MSQTRFWPAAAAVLLIGKGLVASLFLGVFFGPVFDSASPPFRPEGQEIVGAYLVSMVVWAVMFTYLFSRTGGGGWRDGVRFGLVAWLFYYVPMMLGSWAFYTFSVAWTAAGLVSGLAEAIVAGLVVGLIYRAPRGPAAGVEARRDPAAVPV